MHSTKEFIEAKKVLDNSGVIAFPTETVMGLGIYFDDAKAYNYLNKTKNRPEDKPYTLMLGSINEISIYAFISKRDQLIINVFMPGPVTLLLKAKPVVPSYVTHNTGIIGVRVPDMEDVCDFITFCNRPLLVPSANKSGEKPAMSSKEVKDIFGDEVGFVFDGAAIGGKPSTIIDLSGEQVKILREGPISLEDINNVIKGAK